MQRNLIDIKNKISFGNHDAESGFWQKYQRYIVALILLIVLILILAKCTGPVKSTGNEEGTETENTEIRAEDFVLDKELKEDAIPEVNALIESYYTAYAADDLDALSEIAYPMSDNEKSYIGVFSQYIKNYKNIKCYTKSGLTDGSYLVSVYYELKFYGVDTRAQGLDFFYVETDDQGKLYINNRYSPFNISRTENELDPAIYSIIIKYGEQEDVIKLGEEVTAKYEAALASDVDLATMISTTIPAAMKDWLETIKTEEGTESTDSKEEPTEKTDDSKKNDSTEKTDDSSQKNESSEKTDESQSNNSTEKTDDNSKKKSSETETGESNSKKNSKVTIRTTDNVFVRQKPSTDAEVNERAVTGSTFTKIGEADGWTKIEYKGGEAYIKSEYVEEVE